MTTSSIMLENVLMEPKKLRKGHYTTESCSGAICGDSLRQMNEHTSEGRLMTDHLYHQMTDRADNTVTKCCQISLIRLQLRREKKGAFPRQNRS